MKILTVIGARPQFIKAAVVSRVVAERHANGAKLQEVLVHTGQHYDENMSQIFFDELGIPRPEYNLEISQSSHGRMTGRMLEKLDDLIQDEAPDWVLVYGDTNSTIAGALAAVKLHVPVAHVEAGLRSYNRRMPEEINRVLTDHAADLLFTPTDIAVENLRKEGVAQNKIRPSGDVMFDSSIYFGRKAEEASKILEQLGLEQGSYILATCHRAENTDDEGRLRAIFEGLSEAATKIPVVLPLHPRTRGRLEKLGILGSVGEKIKLVDPVGYLDMVMLEKHAALVVTDSGGVQKEAFFFKVPCVTLRDETEWVELVELGWNRLVSPTSGIVVTEGIQAALGTKGKEGQPYGRGNAAELIVDALIAAG